MEELIESLNELLKQFVDPEYGPLNHNKLVEKIVVDTRDGYECSYDKIDYIYSLDVADIFLKVTVISDSYGNDHQILSMQLVKQVNKTIVSYE